MRPSPTCLARTLQKGPKPNLLVFQRPPAGALPASTPRIVSRAKIQSGALVLPAPAPRHHEDKPPTLLESLMAQKVAAGGEWPPNIRLEPVISRETWAPVKKGTRSKLKKMLREI